MTSTTAHDARPTRAQAQLPALTHGQHEAAARELAEIYRRLRALHDNLGGDALDRMTDRAALLASAQLLELRQRLDALHQVEHGHRESPYYGSGCAASRAVGEDDEA